MRANKVKEASRRSELRNRWRVQQSATARAIDRTQAGN
jgi:hypothetical protein